MDWLSRLPGHTAGFKLASWFFGALVLMASKHVGETRRKPPRIAQVFQPDEQQVGMTSARRAACSQTWSAATTRTAACPRRPMTAASLPHWLCSLDTSRAC